MTRRRGSTLPANGLGENGYAGKIDTRLKEIPDNSEVLAYDENADILDGGEKGTVIILCVRVPCWSVP